MDESADAIMKNKVLNIVEIFLSGITFPLCFVKMFVEVGHLPNQDGGIEKVVFRYSLYDNIRDFASPFLVYVAMAIAGFAIVLNIIRLKRNDKKLRIVSDIVFLVAIVFFVILLIGGSMGGRNY